MSMHIKNNMDSLRIQNILTANTKKTQSQLGKIASGLKINGAADDASGYAISEGMRVQIRALSQAEQNAQNGTSMMKVAEGAVSSTVDIIRTMKEKAINAANDTNTDADRQIIQKEFNQMIDQIDDNAHVTYNGKYLIDGSKNNAVKATATVFANNYLEEPDLQQTRKLVDFKDTQGESLNIQESDNITISLVQDGKTYTKTYQVGNNTLSDLLTGVQDGFWGDIMNDGFKGKISFVDSTEYYGYDGFDNKIKPPSGKKTTIITMELKTNDKPSHVEEDNAGLEHQLGGITFSITDRDGKVKTSTNAKLNQFHEVLRAQNASEDNALVLQIGSKANQSIKVGLTDMRAHALALRGSDGSYVSLSNQVHANAAIEVLDNALSKALDQQTTIGAIQSRLSYTIDNIVTARTNIQSAESVIRDADMAKEMTSYTRENLLSQAAQSMLAQSNQQSSNVLSLLQ